jgi:hypothetical protein
MAEGPYRCRSHTLAFDGSSHGIAGLISLMSEIHTSTIFYRLQHWLGRA